MEHSQRTQRASQVGRMKCNPHDYSGMPSKLSWRQRAVAVRCSTLRACEWGVRHGAVQCSCGRAAFSLYMDHEVKSSCRQPLLARKSCCDLQGYGLRKCRTDGLAFSLFSSLLACSDGGPDGRSAARRCGRRTVASIPGPRHMHLSIIELHERTGGQVWLASSPQSQLADPPSRGLIVQTPKAMSGAGQLRCPGHVTASGVV